MSLRHFLLIFLFGGLGAVSRCWLSALIQRLAGTGFPVGTFAVNVLGCLIFGLIWSLCDTRRLISDDTRMLILGGFVGAFTTFSTFAFEVDTLIKESAWAAVVANLCGQTLLGVCAVSLGIAIGRLI